MYEIYIYDLLQRSAVIAYRPALVFNWRYGKICSCRNTMSVNYFCVACVDISNVLIA